MVGFLFIFVLAQSLFCVHLEALPMNIVGFLLCTQCILHSSFHYHPSKQDKGEKHKCESQLFYELFGPTCDKSHPPNNGIAFIHELH